ncbi:MAG: hypothetical protein ACFFBX_07420 [Promethearchaeota archaeon]
MWHDLYHAIDRHQHSLVTDAELRLTGLMSSPSPEVAKEKLGRYLQEAHRLRKKNQPKMALVLVVVSSEFYWRKHQPTRAAGLLLEASDLFYALQNLVTSQQCLTAALELTYKKSSLKWWENELLGTIFLFTACLTLLENPSSINQRLNALRNKLSKKQQAQVRREDGYRIALAVRRAVQRHSLSPIDDLDTKTTLRSRSEYATLYEHLKGFAERYTLIREGLTALRRETQQEDL